MDYQVGVFSSGWTLNTHCLPVNDGDGVEDNTQGRFAGRQHGKRAECFLLCLLVFLKRFVLLVGLCISDCCGRCLRLF